MILMYPTLLDKIREQHCKEAFKPQAHMFYNQRVVPDFKDDGATKYEGLDGMSNKLDDAGNLIDRYDKEKEKYESDLGNEEGDEEKKRKRESGGGQKGEKKGRL